MSHVPHPADAPPAAETTSSEKSERSVLALIATILLPGLGHALRGHAKRGVYFLLALLGVWTVFTVLGAFWLVAVPLSALATLAWLAACAWDAYRVPKGEQNAKAWLVFAGVAGVTLLAAPLVFSAVTRAVSVEAFKVPSGSMCPTLSVGDHMLVDKTAYRSALPVPGDVVVYEGEDDVAFVHRVIAISGQNVEVDDQGRVIVNGAAAKLDATTDSVCDGANAHTELLGNSHRVVLGAGPSAKLRVPKGHVFLLGDNRANSADSRVRGTVTMDSILGRARVIYLRDGGLTYRKLE